MSCGSRHRRYRSSVTEHPHPYAWSHATGHIHHPGLPVAPPDLQTVTTTADDATIPLSLVQDLCARWQDTTPQYLKEKLAAAIGQLMQSPRWHWYLTALPDPSPSGTQDPFVSVCDGRPTIEMPMDMLRVLWTWVLGDTDGRTSVLRWWSFGIDSSRWQELRAYQQEHDPRMTEEDWYYLYRYLSPVLVPDIAKEVHRLLMSDTPDDWQTTMTVFEQWLASSDHDIHTVAVRMLRTWLDRKEATEASACPRRLQALALLSAFGYATVETDRWAQDVAAVVRTHRSDKEVRDMLDRLVASILLSDRVSDRARWITTLWELFTDPTLSDERCWMIAMTLQEMMQDPTAAAMIRDRLRMVPSLDSDMRCGWVWHPLLAGLIRTGAADVALDIIEQAVRRNPGTVGRFVPSVAEGWGNGYDRRILRLIESFPGPHWNEVLVTGITTSVGEEVCARIAREYPDEAVRMIAEHIDIMECHRDWPFAPLPEYLIPWVDAAARNYPYLLRPTTIRRLWLADPDRAWAVTQTMLDSDDLFAQQYAFAAMDAGWGTKYDETIAQTLLSVIQDHPDDLVVAEDVAATAVAGIGIAPPSFIAALLTELAMKGNEDVQCRLIRELHSVWGRGQDDLIVRVLAIIADRNPSGKVWDDSRDTLTRAWHHLPPNGALFLIDRLVTRFMHSLSNEEECTVDGVIAALAPGWDYLPTSQMIECITHHVNHLHEHAHTLTPDVQDTLVAAWAEVIAAGANRLSTSDVHALLSPLWTLSPQGCLDGVVWAVCP